MPKKRSGVVGKVLNFVAWLTGIVVSLSVGFALIGGTLTIPYWLGGDIVAVVAGWIVIISTFVSVITALFNK